jgi:RNA methyltransferase, TrmH family
LLRRRVKALIRMKITSAANPRVKLAAKLRQARGRAEQGRIIIDGVREVGRALDAGVQICEVFACKNLLRNNAAASELLTRIERANISRFDVTPALFEKLAFGERGEGCVAVAEMPRRTLADLQLPKQALLAVIEGVEKPGNVGAVLRSADGAGISAVIVADGGSDLYNPNTIRASLGIIFTLPVVAAPSAETIAWLRKQQLEIFAARVDASTDYSTCDFTRPTAIVLGSEAAGLSDAWHGKEINAIRLPMLGAADSLNVSATAAILFYEAVRQRSARKG